uniref:Uncharacterized protein n=1 Tax=Anguilla anguilla TaxID=7936 RepID=A0A0E9VAD7_ANGAN
MNHHHKCQSVDEDSFSLAPTSSFQLPYLNTPRKVDFQVQRWPNPEGLFKVHML